MTGGTGMRGGGAALRRRGLLAAGAVLPVGLAAAAWLARPAAGLGYGPLALGMPRERALAALGPGALPVPLCSGVEGVGFDWPDPALETAPGRPVPVMAMFGGPAESVSELEVALSRPGGGLDAAAWEALSRAEAAELRRRSGPAEAEETREEDALGLGYRLRLRRAEGTATLHARWMRRSGAGFSRLRWVAAGVRPVIPGAEPA